MDLRTPLEKNTVLHFPEMECVIGSCCGRGANIMAYTGRYRDHLDPSLSHLVLIRELFPYDPQGRIRRAADGSIMADPSAEALYSFHRMTFLRGNEVHIRLAESIPSEIDMNINTFAYNNTLYSLLAFSGGRTLEEDAESIFSAETAGAAGGRKDSFLRAIRIIKGTLMVLEAFHQRGFLHLDISPDNILLVGEGEKERVTLIDYNSVHTIEEIEGHADVYFSVKEGYTAPEVRMGRSGQMGAWTDLYSMAAVFYSCLSGHPLTPVQQVGSAPVGSAASCEKWFASFDEDHRLIVYDPASEASRSFTVPGIDLADIEKMQFILEDEYILFSCRKEDEAFYQAVRLADGETVFRYTAKEKYVYGGLSVCTDEEQGRIFLFNGGSDLTGCCVDAKTWEPLFYIPSLRCVLKNRTCITLSVLKGMKQRPVFTLEEMIMKGSRILED